MRSRHLRSTAVLVAVAAAWGGVAAADVSPGVIKEFRGELVVTKGDLPEGKNEKDTIAKIKAERLKEITGEAREDVVSWHFHYTAFLSKTGSSQLKMEFYTNDKAKKFVADNRLDGVDPKSAVLSGDISINEDEGLSKGKAYLVKLVTDKNVVVASTPLVMK
ncbi:MAG TPA: hypothetical protein VHN14_12195 [Kofleriaceae bacterium]|jgi:hypothetical protein|nr:hypothetical protein [Kofleriaceae bacterium]